MQEIVIRNNGQDDSVFVGTRNIKIEELQINGEGFLGTCKLKFDFDKLVHKHEYNAVSKIWTGKFICVANRGTYSFTPGKVYKVTETDVYDDTNISFKRRNGPGCMCSVGTFKALQNDFLSQGIDIIEYKGGADT